MGFSRAKRGFLLGGFSVALLGGCAVSAPDAVSQEAPIWPGAPPDFTPAPAEETLSTQDHGGWRRISVIRNVSIPTVTVFRPAPGRANGSAMIVLPGGAFAALAWDIEGVEVAQFLAERGVTAFVLKYRVHDASAETMAEWRRDPSVENLLRLRERSRAEAAADALQAVRFVRENARRYAIDADRVGMMGFSAGAMTTLRVLHEADERSRPNIAAPIYGVALEQGAPTPAPPLFTAIARDDGLFSADAVIAMRDAWRAAGSPAEAHIFETGGHGFGLGRPGTDSARLAGLLEEWLRERQFIRP